MIRLGWMWLAALACTGCDGCETPPDEGTSGVENETESVEQPAEAPEAEPSEVAAEAGAAPEVRPPPAPATDAQQAQAAEALRLLQSGRVHSRAERWDAAVTELASSAEAHETASARCELGWALYHAGQLERARAELARGVDLLRVAAARRPRDRRTLGACLYNLGRVAEESDASSAARYYRESIEVRPNDTVAARLAALDAPAPAPRAGACEPVDCHGPYPGPQALDRDRFEAVVREAFDQDGRDEVQLITPPRVTGELETALAIAESGSIGVLGVRTNDTWYVCPLTEFGGSTDVGDMVRAHQWIPGGRPELTVDVDLSWNGYEDGISNQMGQIHRVFVGWADDWPVVYGSIVVADYYRDGRWSDCHCGVDIENGGCCDGFEPIERTTTWTLRTEPDGRVHAEPSNAEGTAGTYDLRRLCEHPRASMYGGPEN